MTHCKLCGRTIDKEGRRMYCTACSGYMNKQNKQESDKRRYEKKRQEKGYKVAIILECDPSDDPLTIGMTIPVEEHKWMKELLTYTPGTIIRQGETRIRIDKVGDRMVEVRI